MTKGADNLQILGLLLKMAGRMSSSDEEKLNPGRESIVSYPKLCNMEDAWKQVILLYESKTRDVSNEINPCKLQFVMNSKVAKVPFEEGLTFVDTIKCGFAENVQITVSPKKSENVLDFWLSVIDDINEQLKEISVFKATFASTKELEFVMSNLGKKERLLNMQYVSAYNDSASSDIVLIVVGRQDCLNPIIEQFAKVKELYSESLRTNKEKLSDPDGINYDFECIDNKKLTDSGEVLGACSSMNQTYNAFPDLTQNQKGNTAENEGIHREYIDVQFGHWQSKAFQSFDIIKELKTIFPDTHFETKSLYVRVSGSSRIEAAHKAGDYACLLCRLDIPESPEGLSFLLQNKFVQDVVKRKLGLSRVEISTEENSEGQNGSRYVIGLQAKITQNTLQLGDLFVNVLIDKWRLRHEVVKIFLEEHRDKIYAQEVSAKETCFCVLKELEVNLTELCSYCAHRCSKAVINFLRDHGTKLMSCTGMKYGLKVSIVDDYICCLDKKSGKGQKCLEEIEQHVTVSLLHFSGERGIKSAGKLGDNRLDNIASQTTVGVSVVSSFSEKKEMTSGNQYYSRVLLKNERIVVSVAEVRLEEEKEKENCGLIVPVNEQMYGVDSLGGDALIKYSKRNDERRIGYWKTIEDSGFVYIPLVVTNEKGALKHDDGFLEAKYSEIFRCLFEKRKTKIYFMHWQNKEVPIEYIRPVLAAFEVEVNQHKLERRELVFSVKTDPEKVVLQVDHCLKAKQLRRQLSYRLSGIFPRPEVSMNIWEGSLLSVKACAFALAVSPDLKLQRGYIEKIISEEAGRELQNELDSKNISLGSGQVIAVDSFNLKKFGVKKLILGDLSPWKINKDMMVLTRFVQDCLVTAENNDCSSVAFPVLGTGKLSYPPRDVAASIFDGIKKYSDETTVGSIHTVYVAVPSSEQDNNRFLKMEKRRREPEEATEEEDVDYLEIEARKTKCRVLTTSSLKHLYCFVKEVEVHFQPSGGWKGTNKIDRATWKLQVDCGTTDKHLTDAMKEVIKECNDQKITHIIVYLNQDFQIPSDRQIEAIIGAVGGDKFSLEAIIGAAGPYEYLQVVNIVVEEDEFKLFANQDVSTSQTYGRLTFPGSKWQKVVHRGRKVSSNVLLAGENEETVRNARRQIEELLVDREMQIDNVSANINRGFIEHLSKSSETYEKWIQDVQEVFHIKVTRFDNGTSAKVIGTFENIKMFEKYLESDFPDIPSRERKDDPEEYLPVEEHYFEKPPDIEIESIPVEETDLLRLLGSYPDICSHLRVNNDVKSCTVSNGKLNIEYNSWAKKTVYQEIISAVKWVKWKPCDQVRCQTRWSFQQLADRLAVSPADKIVLEFSEKCRMIYVYSAEVEKAERIALKLKEELKKNERRGTVIVNKTKLWMKHLQLSLQCFDITRLKTECIVSPLDVQNAVQKEISGKAGKTYLGERKALLEKEYPPVSGCFKTSAGNLSCEYIVHVHCPIKTKLQGPDRNMVLGITYFNCLKLADELKVKSMGLPLLCTEIGNYRIDEGAEHFFNTVYEFQPKECLSEVYLVDKNESYVKSILKEFTRFAQNSTPHVVSVEFSNLSVCVTQSGDNIKADAVVLISKAGSDIDQAVISFGEVTKRKITDCIPTMPIIGIGYFKDDPTSQHVLVSLLPETSHTEEFKRNFRRLALSKALGKACCLSGVSTVLITSSCWEDLNDGNNRCRWMIEVVLQFVRDQACPLKEVYLVCPDRQSYLSMMIELFNSVKQFKLQA